MDISPMTRRMLKAALDGGMRDYLKMVDSWGEKTDLTGEFDKVMNEYTSHLDPDQADAGAQPNQVDDPQLARPDRDAHGRFVNHPGPGRPRRQTEAAYMRVLADLVTLGEWSQIAARAVIDAKAGDAKAREWIARYVLGNEPMSLTALALRDLADVTDDDELAAALTIEGEQAFFSDKTPFQAALSDRAEAQREAAQREAQAQAEADRVRKRAEREARKAAQLAADQAAQP